MKLYHVVGILAVIIIIGGLSLFFVGQGPTQPDPETPTGKLVDDQLEVPSNWKRYQNPQFDFSFRYPPEGTTTVEAGQAKITYLGPDNRPGSEITDGFTFYANTLDGAGRSLSEIANDQFGEDSADLEVVTEPNEVTRFERDTYSYEIETMLGPILTHVVLEAEDEQFFEVKYMISGDEDGTYADYVDMMIDTLRLNGNTDEAVDTRGVESVTVTDNEILDQSGTVLLSNDIAPGSMEVDEDVEFGVSGQFTSAALSPDSNLIAFTISGAAHGGGWIAKLEQGPEASNITPVAFQYGGSVEVIEWSPDSRFVVFSLSTPAPSELLWVVDSANLKAEYVSKIGQQIEVEEETETDPPFSYEFIRWESPHTLCFSFEDQDEQCTDVIADK